MHHLHEANCKLKRLGGYLIQAFALHLLLGLLDNDHICTPFVTINAKICFNIQILSINKNCTVCVITQTHP